MTRNNSRGVPGKTVEDDQEPQGRSYSILSDGPRAFLPGDWVNEFIRVKLKHQRLQSQEIRDQKHQERLWEIEDLKDRFGIRD